MNAELSVSGRRGIILIPSAHAGECRSQTESRMMPLCVLGQEGLQAVLRAADER